MEEGALARARESPGAHVCLCQYAMVNYRSAAHRAVADRMCHGMVAVDVLKLVEAYYES